MKVLIATGIEKLDNDLSRMLPENNIETVGTSYHRSIVNKMIKETGADTVIISPALSGDDDIVELIRTMREKGIRVVALPGDLSLMKAQELIEKLVPYGVYDFVYDPVRPVVIIEKLLRPGKLGDIPKEIIDKLQRANISLPIIGEEKNEDTTGQQPEKHKHVRREELNPAKKGLTKLKIKNPINSINNKLQQITDETKAAVRDLLERKDNNNYNYEDSKVVTVWGPTGAT
ncbi:chemotaxis response regulator CheB [Desulfohalotomaculum tongense]|uniref:hypothetical protein n=1 Tax=Desulforadius tongensis TaxID=1216062 RepID=UPI00195C826D|nr:hypothetical protein [Desulforadius tongensis]MBM7854957.1 chemotaxis response regulator CheB [Desulforadius tongensis]